MTCIITKVFTKGMWHKSTKHAIYIYTGYATQYLIVPLKENALFHVYVVQAFIIQIPKLLVGEMLSSSWRCLPATYNKNGGQLLCNNMMWQNMTRYDWLWNQVRWKCTAWLVQKKPVTGLPAIPLTHTLLLSWKRKAHGCCDLNSPYFIELVYSSFVPSQSAKFKLLWVQTVSKNDTGTKLWPAWNLFKGEPRLLPTQ